MRFKEDKSIYERFITLFWARWDMSKIYNLNNDRFAGNLFGKFVFDLGGKGAKFIAVVDCYGNTVEELKIFLMIKKDKIDRV